MWEESFEDKIANSSDEMKDFLRKVSNVLARLYKKKVFYGSKYFDDNEEMAIFCINTKIQSKDYLVTRKEDVFACALLYVLCNDFKYRNTFNKINIKFVNNFGENLMSDLRYNEHSSDLKEIHSLFDNEFNLIDVKYNNVKTPVEYVEKYFNSSSFNELSNHKLNKLRDMEKNRLVSTEYSLYHAYDAGQLNNLKKQASIALKNAFESCTNKSKNDGGNVSKDKNISESTYITQDNLDEYCISYLENMPNFSNLSDEEKDFLLTICKIILFCQNHNVNNLLCNKFEEHYPNNRSLNFFHNESRLFAIASLIALTKNSKYRSNINKYLRMLSFESGGGEYNLSGIIDILCYTKYAIIGRLTNGISDDVDILLKATINEMNHGKSTADVVLDKLRETISSYFNHGSARKYDVDYLFLAILKKIEEIISQQKPSLSEYDNLDNNLNYYSEYSSLNRDLHKERLKQKPVMNNNESLDKLLESGSIDSIKYLIYYDRIYSSLQKTGLDNDKLNGECHAIALVLSKKDEIMKIAQIDTNDFNQCVSKYISNYMGGSAANKVIEDINLSKMDNYYELYCKYYEEIKDNCIDIYRRESNQYGNSALEELIGVKDIDEFSERIEEYTNESYDGKYDNGNVDDNTLEFIKYTSSLYKELIKKYDLGEFNDIKDIKSPDDVVELSFLLASFKYDNYLHEYMKSYDIKLNDLLEYTNLDKSIEKSSSFDKNVLIYKIDSYLPQFNNKLECGIDIDDILKKLTHKSFITAFFKDKIDNFNGEITPKEYISGYQKIENKDILDEFMNKHKSLNKEFVCNILSTYMKMYYKINNDDELLLSSVLYNIYNINDDIGRMYLKYIGISYDEIKEMISFDKSKDVELDYNLLNTKLNKIFNNADDIIDILDNLFKENIIKNNRWQLFLKEKDIKSDKEHFMKYYESYKKVENCIDKLSFKDGIYDSSNYSNNVSNNIKIFISILTKYEKIKFESGINIDDIMQYFNCTKEKNVNLNAVRDITISENIDNSLFENIDNDLDFITKLLEVEEIKKYLLDNNIDRDMLIRELVFGKNYYDTLTMDEKIQDLAKYQVPDFDKMKTAELVESSKRLEKHRTIISDINVLYSRNNDNAIELVSSKLDECVPKVGFFKSTINKLTGNVSINANEKLLKDIITLATEKIKELDDKLIKLNKLKEYYEIYIDKINEYFVKICNNIEKISNNKENNNMPFAVISNANSFNSLTIKRNHIEDNINSILVEYQDISNRVIELQSEREALNSIRLDVVSLIRYNSSPDNKKNMKDLKEFYKKFRNLLEGHNKSSRSSMKK